MAGREHVLEKVLGEGFQREDQPRARGGVGPRRGGIVRAARTIAAPS